MMVVDASISNWKTYLIYKWFQLVSSNLKKTKVIAKMEKWQKNWRIFRDSQTAFPDSALSYIQLRDTWCHYSLITNTDIHISFSCGWKSEAKRREEESYSRSWGPFCVLVLRFFLDDQLGSGGSAPFVYSTTSQVMP